MKISDRSRTVRNQATLVSSWFSATVLGAGCLLSCSLIASAAPGDVDSTFNPNVSGSSSPFVLGVATQADGNLLLSGGSITTVGGVTRNNIARVGLDGSLDPNFNPNANAAVNPIAVLADGKILVGGSFTSIGGVARARLALLNSDGTAAPGYNPAPNGNVNSVSVLPDGKFIIAGEFTQVTGQTRNLVARLNSDGTLDPTFIGGSISGWLYAAAVQPDGKVLIVGFFTSVAGTARSNVARLQANGALDTSFNPVANDETRAVTVQPDGKILIGGKFTQVAGQTRNRIARLNPDGTLDGGFNPGATDTVLSILLQADGRIVYSESEATAATVARNRIARLAPNGTVDSTFNPLANNNTLSMAIQDNGEVVIGGRFTNVGGLTRNRIARLKNDPPTQQLSAPTNNRIQWLRGGTSAEALHVTFDLSTDNGATWQPLGAGSRISGGWEKTGLSLPTGGQLRALARTSDGKGNGGLLRTITSYSFAPPNSPPVFSGYSISTPYQTSAAVTLKKLLAKASDPDGDAITVTAAGATSAHGGTAVLQATTILYTPPGGFSGNDTFPVTLTDALGNNTTGTVTVIAGQAPTAGGTTTNPPQITTLPGGGIKLRFQGIPGRAYQIQRSPNMSSWTNIATATADSHGVLSFTDETPPQPNAFYRLALP